MIKDFARVLRDQLHKDITLLSEDMASGTCRSYDEYQKLCGVIQGLARAESYLQTLLEKVENDDE